MDFMVILHILSRLENVEAEILELLKRTKESLYMGIEQAVAGKRVGDIGYAVQKYVESFGYSVVRDLVGHGVGTKPS